MCQACEDYPPHTYVITTPYKGCGVCGYGPGAYVHNTFNVKDYEARKIVAESPL